MTAERVPPYPPYPAYPAYHTPAAGRAPAPIAPEHVRLGPFFVCDGSSGRVVDAVVAGGLASAGLRPWVAFALHVGGLNARSDADYVRALNTADLVYADGVSVVLLARLAGAKGVARAGTTDIGWDVLREYGSALGRRPRVALLGGPIGLAQRAGRVLEEQAGVDVVHTEPGFHSDWTVPLERLRASQCDVLFVGLGAPREMKWVAEHREQLPRCLVMSCGGWFGFIVSDEQRAPGWAQSIGLEWAFRVKQAPRRLAGRYVRGVGASIRLAVRVLAERRSHGRQARPRPPGAPTD